MLDIRLVAVGPVRDLNLRAACVEYEKRLKPFARISITEVKPEPFRDASREDAARRAEGERVLAALARYPVDTVRLLSESGEAFNSLTFAQSVSAGPVVFVIGGALGWSDEVLAAPYKRVSLSPLTFPHELARLVLFEQLYRAATIGAGKRYHY